MIFLKFAIVAVVRWPMIGAQNLLWLLRFDRAGFAVAIQLDRLYGWALKSAPDERRRTGRGGG